MHILEDGGLCEGHPFYLKDGTPFTCAPKSLTTNEVETRPSYFFRVEQPADLHLVEATQVSELPVSIQNLNSEGGLPRVAVRKYCNTKRHLLTIRQQRAHASVIAD